MRRTPPPGTILPPVPERAGHRIHATLHRRLPLSYWHIKPAVARLRRPGDNRAQFESAAEKRFDDYVACYLRPAGIATMVRSALSALAIVVEVAVPFTVFVGLGRIGTPGPLRWGLTAASLLLLTCHLWGAKGHRSWKQRAGWLTAAAVIAGLIPVAEYAFEAGVAPTPDWFDHLIRSDLVRTLMLPCSAVAAAAGVTLLALLVGRVLRRTRCRVLAALMPKRAWEQMVCELVQTVDLIFDGTQQAFTSRSHRIVIVELLDSTIDLFQRGRLIASLDMSEDAHLAARSEFADNQRRLATLRDRLLRPRVLAGGHITELSDMAARFLVDSDTEQDFVDIMECGRSRIVLAAQVLGAGAIAVGFVVAGSWLSQKPDAIIVPIMTGAAAGILTTVVLPAVRKLLPGVDLSWLPKIIPAKGAGDGPEEKGDAKKDDAASTDGADEGGDEDVRTG